jgi:hypothetical protein
MWVFEHSLVAKISRQQVWAVWSEVEKWNEWDVAVEWTKLEGMFEIGATYVLKPKDGPKVRAITTRCDPLVGFTDVSRLPLCKLVFDHQVEEIEDGVRVTHRASMTGLTTFLFRRLIGKNIERDMPKAMQRLVEKASAIRYDAEPIAR